MTQMLPIGCRASDTEWFPNVGQKDQAPSVWFSCNAYFKASTCCIRSLFTLRLQRQTTQKDRDHAEAHKPQLVPLGMWVIAAKIIYECRRVSQPRLPSDCGHTKDCKKSGQTYPGLVDPKAVWEVIILCGCRKHLYFGVEFYKERDEPNDC